MPDKPTEPFALASGEGMLLMTKMTRGGVVFSSDLAVKLAEVLCDAHYGEAELARQKPFIVTDNDTYWRVEGRLNCDGAIDGPGAFFVSIGKYDGRVTDFGRLLPYHAHPSVVPLIEQHLVRKKTTDPK